MACQGARTQAEEDLEALGRRIQPRCVLGCGRAVFSELKCCDACRSQLQDDPEWSRRRGEAFQRLAPLIEALAALNVAAVEQLAIATARKVRELAR